MKENITAILVLTACILPVILFVRVGEKPTLYETIVERMTKQGEVSLAELNTMIETKMLIDSGIPQEAIYAYVLHDS